MSIDYTQKLTKSTLALKLSVSAPITLCGLPHFEMHKTHQKHIKDVRYSKAWKMAHFAFDHPAMFYTATVWPKRMEPGILYNTSLNIKF